VTGSGLSSGAIERRPEFYEEGPCVKSSVSAEATGLTTRLRAVRRLVQLRPPSVLRSKMIGPPPTAQLADFGNTSAQTIVRMH